MNAKIKQAKTTKARRTIISKRPIVSVKPTTSNKTTAYSKARFKLTTYIMTASCSFFLSGNSYAANSPEESITKLEEELLWLKEESFVETATKTKELIKKSGASVTVITKKELEQMGAFNLMDALNRLTGFNVQNTNIGIPSISVRGAKTDSNEKILFLVNGHSINNNLVNGGATWTYSDFRIEDVKRIEVVRGPGSTLYGTGALVAIINLVTKTGADIQDGNSSTKVSLSTGSDATKRANLHVAEKNKQYHYALNFNISSTDGTEEYVSNDAAGNSGYSKDNERRVDIGFNASKGNFAVQGKYIERKAGPFVGIGSALNDESQQDYKEYFIEISHHTSPLSELNLSTKLHYDLFEANNYWEIRSEGFANQFPEGLLGSPKVRNEKLGIEVQLDYKLSDNNKIVAGADFEHHTQFDVIHLTNFDPITFAPSPPYRDVSDIWNWNGNHDRDISAVFIQDIWDINKDIRLIAGARNDHYSDFGNSFNPRASLTWQLSPRYILTGIYGQAFRAPNFGELYNVNTPVIQGNKNLKAEEIETYELSLDTEINRRSDLKTTYFHNNIENIIGYEAGIATNNNRQVTSGLELEFQSMLQDGSKFNLNYTYQYPKNISQNQRVNGIPMHTAHAAFTYRHSKDFNAYIATNYRSELKQSSSELDAYTTFDIAFNWQSNMAPFKITASIYNLFDRQTSDFVDALASGLPGEGRRIMLRGTLEI